MKKYNKLLFFLSIFFIISSINAHHNLQAEFGSFDSPLSYVEGVIIASRWGNPHVGISIEITGGDLPIGEKWQLQGHVPGAMEGAYGFSRDEFSVGASMKAYVYPNLRGLPVAHPRAMGLINGQLRSSQRYRDYQDLANEAVIIDGVFVDSGIRAVCNLNGGSPNLAGAPTVRKLSELGYLDNDGRLVGVEINC
ncbi:MAG: hypothetical protein CBC38_05975 [Gammaproteobacteria bacterium TMED78]|nr:MAG: hypothetical protein CBC38_05975 [Gammaproteobacteria bacterium TMED78]|tara:strand:+ start:355 stop:936 length:582 start_codon:yes stop_codon:yes gene_type:complete